MRLARILFRRFPRIGREVAAHVAPHQGYIDGLSHTHVTGWVCNFADGTERVQHEAILENTGEVLLRAQADRFLPGLKELGVGDGAHGFYHRLPRRLTLAEQAQLRVRVVANGKKLTRADTMSTVYQPLAFVIMDIVDNCNLRCPFCLYNYEGVNKTNLMNEETIDAAVRFAPYAADGAFWYSCLHEPTMHPRFTEYSRKMPPLQRDQLAHRNGSTVMLSMPPGVGQPQGAPAATAQPAVEYRHRNRWPGPTIRRRASSPAATVFA